MRWARIVAGKGETRYRLHNKYYS